MGSRSASALGFAVALWVAVPGCGPDASEATPARSLTAPAQPLRSGENHAPEVRAVRIVPRDATAGMSVRAEAETYDADGDPLRLRYRWWVDGHRTQVRGASFSTRGLTKGSEVAVEVVAADGHAESDPVRTSIRLRNRPPEVVRAEIDPLGVVPPGAELEAHVEAHDPDGDPLELDPVWLVNGKEHTRGTLRMVAQGLHRGDRIRVRVVARDDESASEPVESNEVRIGNAAPVVVSKPPSFDQDGTFRYRIEARDPDGDRNLRYRLVEGPRGMAIDPVLGVLTWTPEPSQVGRHVVEVAVEDPQGGRGGQRFYLTVREQLGESRPEPASLAE